MAGTSRYRGKYGKTGPGPLRLSQLARSRSIKVGVGVAVVAAGATRLGFALTSGASRAESQAPAASEPSAHQPRVTSQPATTTTTDSVPAGRPIAVPANGLSIGSRGPAVETVKQRLTELRYDPGPITDRFDQRTYYAVIAFEKVHGGARTGRVTQSVADAMEVDHLPPPLVSGAEPTRVEVDLSRQALFFWTGGRLARILPVSSGFGGHYCGDDGSCGIAITPIGAYRATGKILGWHKSPLGRLWNPVFFNQGIAIHGEPSVPPTPASHGCVRIPMGDSPWLYATLAVGTPVYVLDATHVPVPFTKGGSVGPVQPGGTPPTSVRRRATAPASPPQTPAPTPSPPGQPGAPGQPGPTGGPSPSTPPPATTPPGAPKPPPAPPVSPPSTTRP